MTVGFFVGQKNQRLNMLGLREHIERFDCLNGVFAVGLYAEGGRLDKLARFRLDQRARENAQIARQRCGIAGDHDDLFYLRLQKQFQHAAGNARAGRVEHDNGVFFPFENAAGTWFFSYLRGSQYAQIRSGGLTLSYGNDGTAEISLTLYDGNGYSVTSSFRGQINYAN